MLFDQCQFEKMMKFLLPEDHLNLDNQEKSSVYTERSGFYTLNEFKEKRQMVLQLALEYTHLR